MGVEPQAYHSENIIEIKFAQKVHPWLKLSWTNRVC